jgi:two-component system OmpR family response regulator
MPKPRVLIVEDDPAIRSGVAGALAADGYETVEAEDGERGLACWRDDGSVALVLLDIMLPKIDGLHVLESIRERRPRLPVICLTALGEEADRVRGLRAGADDYIVKPFGLDELLARVEAVLRRSAGGPVDERERRIRHGRGVFEIAGCRIDLARQEVTPPGGRCARAPPARGGGAGVPRSSTGGAR